MLAELTGDGRVDALVLPGPGSRPVLLYALDVWAAPLQLEEPAQGIALFERAQPGGSSAFLTAGSGGVSLWTWTAGRLEARAVPTPWPGASAVATFARAGSPWAFVCILDEEGRRMNVQIWTQDPPEFFASAASADLGVHARGIALFDEDGDGTPEIAAAHAGGLLVSSWNGAQLAALPGDGGHGLLARLRRSGGPAQGLAWLEPVSAVESRVNLLTASGVLATELGFRASTLAAGDADGDGTDELFVLESATATPWILRQAGSGLGSPQTVPVGEQGINASLEHTLALGDVENDGDLDLVVGGLLARGSAVHAELVAPRAYYWGLEEAGAELQLVLALLPPETLLGQQGAEVAVTVWRQDELGEPIAPEPVGHRRLASDVLHAGAPVRLTLEGAQYPTPHAAYIVSIGMLYTDESGVPLRPTAHWFAFSACPVVQKELEALYGESCPICGSRPHPGLGVPLRPPRLPPLPPGTFPDE
jgi:hypothetical protein